jgi:hypothetical protein
MNTTMTLRLLAVGLSAAAAFGQAVQLDPAFAPYKASQGVSGGTWPWTMGAWTMRP